MLSRDSVKIAPMLFTTKVEEADPKTGKVELVEKEVLIPEHIEFPSIRIPIGKNVLEINDVIVVELSIFNNKGKIKLQDTQKIVLVEFPKNGKVIGRLALNLIETSLDRVIKPTEPIEEPKEEPKEEEPTGDVGSVIK